MGANSFDEVKKISCRSRSRKSPGKHDNRFFFLVLLNFSSSIF